MMDVVFSRSACGSLKMVQHYGQGEYTGTVGVIYAAPPGGQGIRRRLRQCTADGNF